MVQDFVELHETPTCPFLPLVTVLLSTSKWSVDHSFQLGIICKLVENAFCPTIQVTNVMFSTGPIIRPTGNRTAAGLCVADKNLLSLKVQPVFNIPHCSFISYSITLDIEGVMKKAVRLAEVKINNIHYSPIVQQVSHFIVRG